MSDSKNYLFKRINVLFNSFWILAMVAGIGLAVTLIGSSSALFYRALTAVFDRIPYVGNLAYSYAKATQMIDLRGFVTSIFNPLIIVDALYFVIPFIVFQIVVMLMKRYIVKHDHALLAAVTTLIILVSMWMTTPNSMFLTRMFSTPTVMQKDTIIRWVLALEIVGFIALLYALHREGRFDLRQLWTHERARKYTRNGLIATFAVMAVMSVGLITTRVVVNDMKQNFHVSYVLDFTPNQDGHILLKVPSKIKDPLKYVGVTLPEYIDENTVLKQFGVESLDVGAIINGFTDDTINKGVAQFISVPMFNAVVSLIIVVSVAVLEFVSRRNQMLAPPLYLIETILLAGLFFGIAYQFGVITMVLAGIALIGVSIHLITYMKESGMLERMALKLKSLRTH